MWKDFKLPTEAENVTSFYLKFNNIFTYEYMYCSISILSTMGVDKNIIFQLSRLFMKDQEFNEG